MHLVTRCQMALVERQLQVEACHTRIRKAEKEARKENRAVPRAEMDKLQSDLRDAKANVFSAEAGLMGASKWPPL